MGFAEFKQNLPKSREESIVDTGSIGSGKKTPSETVKYQDVINTLQNKGDLSSLIYADTLDKIAQSQKGKALPEAVAQLLGKMNTTNSQEQMGVYIAEIEKITKTKQLGVNAVIDDAKDQTTGVETSVVESQINNAKIWMFGSSDYQSVARDVIDGQVSSAQEFVNRVKALKSEIQSEDEFKNLTSNEKKAVLSNLDNLVHQVKEGEKIQLDFLNKHFNDLAKQIDAQKGPDVQLMVDGEAINFPTKEKAFSFLRTLKQNAESEFQGSMRNLAESLGEGLMFILSHGYDFLTYPYVWTANRASNVGESIENDDSAIYTVFMGTVTVLGLIGSINYSETLYRRVVQDTLGRFGVSAYQLGNFDKNRLSFHPDPNNAQAQSQYNSRLDMYNFLKEQGATKTGTDKIAFEKELRNLLDYANVKSNTFWLKARALQNDYGILKRYGMAFRYGTKYTFGDIDSIMSNFINTHGDDNKKLLIEGGSYVFDTFSLKQSPEGVVQGAEAAGESQYIRNIKNYIRSRNDLSRVEQKSMIARIDAFMSDLKITPRGLSAVKEQLFAIVEGRHLTASELKGEMEKKYPFLKISSEGSEQLSMKQKISAQFDNYKTQVVFQYGKHAPASFVGGQTMAVKLYDMIDQGKWSGSQEELEKLFQKIDSGNIHIRDLYKNFPINPVLYLDLIKSIKSKYGLELPHISKLEKFTPAISHNRFNKILESGADAAKLTESNNKIITSGLEVDGIKFKPISGLENYIKYILSNTQESAFKMEFDNLMSVVSQGEVLYGELDFFRELHRVQQGYVPTYFVLEELHNALNPNKGESKFTGKARDEINTMIELGREGKINISRVELSKLKIGSLPTYAESDSFSIEAKKEFIKSIAEFEELDDFDYKKGIGSSDDFRDIFQKLQTRYKGELDYIKVLYQNDSLFQSVQDGLMSFAKNMKTNEYTNGQANAILQQIFNGTPFSDIDIDEILKNTSDHFSEFDAKMKLKNLLAHRFNNMTPVEQRHLIAFIKDNQLIHMHLPDALMKAIDNSDQEGIINQYKKTLAGIIEDLQRGKNQGDIDVAKERFNKVLDSNLQIDTTTGDFAQIKSDFYGLVEQKEASFVSSTSPVEVNGGDFKSLELGEKSNRLRELIGLAKVEYLIKYKTLDLEIFQELLDNTNKVDFVNSVSDIDAYRSFLASKLDITLRSAEEMKIVLYDLDYSKIKSSKNTAINSSSDLLGSINTLKNKKILQSIIDQIQLKKI